MTLNLEKTRAAYERAAEVLPLGVTSNFRYWGKEDTYVFSGGKGAYIYDMDENRYVDYRLGFGPIILGHAYEPLIKRVAESITAGTVFAATHMWEVSVAERIQRMCGVERVRFAMSGSEATMHALRIARAYTGRQKVLKFEGHYHGMYDYMLFSTAGIKLDVAGPPDQPVPTKQSMGIPEHIDEMLIVIPFNNLEFLEETLHKHGHDIAAAIFEPVMGNVAAINAKPGFLARLIELCKEYGIVSIMDEVKTGFRIAPGGAQQAYGLQPDMVTYAKAMGNGFPIAAIGGRAAIMDVIGPGKTMQGGTYCGNVVGTAAADLVLETLEDGSVLKSIEERGNRLAAGLSEILTRHGIQHYVNGPGAMFGLIISDEPEHPADVRAYKRSREGFYEHLIMDVIKRGVMPDPDAREPWFQCAALTDADVAFTLEQFEEAVKAVKG